MDKSAKMGWFESNMMDGDEPAIESNREFEFQYFNGENLTESLAEEQKVTTPQKVTTQNGTVMDITTLTYGTNSKKISLPAPSRKVSALSSGKKSTNLFLSSMDESEEPPAESRPSFNKTDIMPSFGYPLGNQISTFTPKTPCSNKRKRVFNDNRFRVNVDNSPIGQKPPSLLPNTVPKIKKEVSFVTELQNNYVPESKKKELMKNVSERKPKKLLKKISVMDDELYMRFEMQRTLGKGQFGQVGLYKNYFDNQLYAIKVVGDGTSKIKKNSREMHILSLVHDHHNIVSYHHFWYDMKKFYLVMEYCPGKSLSDRVKDLARKEVQFSEEELQHFTENLLSGLKHLHEKHAIVHLDIKPANILLKFPPSSIKETTQQVYKIADFGCATDIEAGDIDAGDANYRDPVLNPPKVDPIKLDIYAAALAVAECTRLKFHNPCFSKDSYGQDCSELVDYEQYEIQTPPEFCQRLSDGFHKLIRTMAHPVMAKRPTAHEALVELESLDGNCHKENLKEENTRMKAEIKRLKEQLAKNEAQKEEKSDKPIDIGGVFMDEGFMQYIDEEADI